MGARLAQLRGANFKTEVPCDEKDEDIVSQAFTDLDHHFGITKDAYDYDIFNVVQDRVSTYSEFVGALKMKMEKHE